MSPGDIAFIGILCMIFGNDFIELVGAVLLIIAVLK